MKKQDKLERVLDNRELLQKLQEHDLDIVCCRDFESVSGAKAGNFLSYLEDIGCLELYNGRTPKRYKTDTFDLERLQELKELYAPQKKALE